MNGFIQDIRYASRRLLQHPGFSFVVLITLALGIGANTAVFTVINTVLLRELPYSDPEQLMVFHWKNNYGKLGDDLSGPAYNFIREHNSSFQSIALIDPVNAGANLSSGDEPSYSHVLRVSSNYFSTLGKSPELGTAFDSSTAASSNDSKESYLAVLSHAVWQQQFSADPRVIGSTVTVNGQKYTITGVMTADFHSYPPADMWVSMSTSSLSRNPAANEFRIVGRLKPGTTSQQAQHELDVLSGEFRNNYGLQGRLGQLGFMVEAYHDYISGDLKSSLLLLAGSVMLVLLIACANLASLLLARGHARSRELAIRVALGGSKLRLFRLVMTETVVWALLGGSLGLLLAHASVPFFIKMSPQDIQRAGEIQVDGNVAIFTILISFFTAFVCGVAPAISATRGHSKNSLQAGVQSGGGVRTTAGPQHAKATRLLVSAQVAISTVLLVGTGLLVLTFFKTSLVTPGFDPKHLVVFQSALTGERYSTTMQTQQLTDKILQRLLAFPGVTHAATVVGVPTEKGLNSLARPAGQAQNETRSVEYRPVSIDYLATMAIPLVSGRNFNNQDSASSTPVVLINQALARRWWPGRIPLGEQIQISESTEASAPGTSRQVVGVVGDVLEAGLDRSAPPVVYVPLTQVPDQLMALVNKSFPTSFLLRAPNGTQYGAKIKELVHSTDPTLPVASVQPASEILHSSLSRREFYASVFGVFASFALFLTGMGIFGVLTFQLSQRTREVAIRMALGCPREQVLRLFIVQGLSVVAIGLAFGIAGAVILTKYLSSMLYKVSPNDPAAIAATGLVILIIGAAASWVPAFRAASIEPIAALRSE